MKKYILTLILALASLGLYAQSYEKNSDKIEYLP